MPSVVSFKGARGPNEFVTYEAPQNWRQGIAELNPNGSTIITGLTSRMRSESTDDQVFNWWEREMAEEAGAVSSIYINSDLSTEYVYSTHQATFGVAGSVVYAKVALAIAQQFVEGNDVILRDASQYSVDLFGKVVNVFYNGASSSIAIRLREADDNGSTAATYNLATVDRVLKVGSSHPVGGTRPESVTYDPTRYYNYCSITRTPLDLPRSTMKTKLRTRDPYMDAKEQGLLYHGVALEKKALWSIPYAGTGVNGKPEYTTAGMIYWIKNYASANCDDYSLNTDFNGSTWLDAGEEWLDYMLSLIFKKKRDTPPNMGGEKWALCGNGALLGIQKLVKNGAMYSIMKEETAYGVRVVRWITVFGDILLKVHPLFSWETTNNYSMLVVEPDNHIWRPLDDTFFCPDILYRKGGSTGYDGLSEEWITEGGFEHHFPEMEGYLNGVGVDNIV